VAETVVGVFLEQAERRGSAPFLHRWNGSAWEALSWSECRTRVLRIGAALIAEGVEPGEAVILFSKNRVEWILADLGIQGAGGVTVPVYATSTPETIAKIAANCKARIAIAGDPELAGNLPKGLKVVEMDGELARWMATDPPEAARAELEKRLAAPAPLAVSSGTMPTTMAAVVIRMGRRRMAAAFSMAARRPSASFSCRWLA